MDKIKDFKKEMRKAEREMFLREIRLSPYKRWLWLTEAFRFVSKTILTSEVGK